MTLHQWANVMQGEFPNWLVNVGNGMGVAHGNERQEKAEVSRWNRVLQHAGLNYGGSRLTDVVVSVAGMETFSSIPFVKWGYRLTAVRRQAAFG